ncbi:hypothetical protein [Brevibacillus sp. NRS-1366]|uniref:hypothetical protein n=1 Tax=Brevibacillus sp. NRS-1366 TaxID=3233899 RepID=UPI003D263580
MNPNHDWNKRVLEILEGTFAYDAAMTNLLMPKIAKQYTTPDEQNENYRARLLHYKADLKEKRV